MSLVVYKSSAGSGKTTTLVNEYLKITLRQPHQFRHILAVTFTNNAANEMKSRILTALEKIISGKARDEGELQDVFTYLDLGRDQLIDRAKELQKLIIHRYDEFSISTIDAFVHRIIRTFATDVQLPHNFEVVIDKDDFVPDIVDDLFSRVGSDKALTDIMVKFVLSQTDQEKSYDPGRVISEFVEKQLGEEGFDYLEIISNLGSNDFVEIIARMIAKLESVKKVIKTNGQKAIDLILQKHLDKGDFFQGERGIYGYFKKCSLLADDKHLVPNSYIQATINEDKWISRKADPSAINSITSIKNELTTCFENIFLTKDNYYSLSFIYKKIYALALSSQIRSIFSDYSLRTQKVHISEFNKKISQEISGQPVPFIFERLGRKYRYFLIDEFQDTSVLQWKNLFPLIEESLSYGNFNMLVGDAKQAIYRFRNGEVELFSRLPELYGFDETIDIEIRKKLIEENYKEIALEKNWRSRSEIVQFNNDFFEIVKNQSPDRISEIYKGHKQLIPEGEKKQGGFVSIDLIDTNSIDDYAESRLHKIKENVDNLIKTGYSLSDICVLTRTNFSATEVASFLLENGYHVVTSESLLLINSAEVRTIISFLRLLNNPEARIHHADFVHNFQLIRHENNFHEVCTQVIRETDKGLNYVFDALDIDIDVNRLVSLPVYEITELVIRTLKLNRKVNIYLQYFLDFVIETQENGHGVIDAFLELWDKKNQKLYITMPEGGNAIQIMTTHKAKGLKFETVIIDITNRSTRKGRSEFFTELNLDGFPELKVGLLPLSKELDKIGLQNEYEIENEKTSLDFLNLVYVAFTRTVSALMIFGHKGGGKKDKFTELLKVYLSEKELWNDEGDIFFSTGILKAPSGKSSSRKESKLKLKEMISSPWNDRIKVAPADEVYWEAIDSKPARVYGNLIHNMLSKIQQESDIAKVVHEYRSSSVIDDEEADSIKIILNRVVTHPELTTCFEKDVLVINERDILDVKKNLKTFYRPDRVVLLSGNLVIIDYKTGEKEEKHIKQINQYAELLSEMGYDNISKKLVYINDEVEVKNIG